MKNKESAKTIIVTIDKDLDCCPGWHYRPPHQGKEGYKYFITLEEANRNFYKQLLQGDTTDNIQGIPGVGKKSPFMKIIDTLTNPRAMAEFCFLKYFEYEMALHCDKDLPVVKKIAYDKFLENGRLVYIRREENEIWEPPKEGKQKG